MVEIGRRLYAAECAGCHGIELKGEPNWQVMAPSGRVKAPPQDETGHSFEHSDAELFQTVKYGVREQKGERDVVSMPVFADRLQDRQMLAALAYIKSRWPVSVRASQATRNPGFRGMPATEDWTFPGECRTVDGRKVDAPDPDRISTAPRQTSETSSRLTRDHGQASVSRRRVPVAPTRAPPLPSSPVP
ncbi:c-type cytochrome [Azospirillum canadense]|uniref:c-type cytochrome n=1 Tax=Azospirillum canadense TaxID=403962 RepID=UPI002226AB51|nr:cytochrome c [Azospirillum canadense]MCW2241482.1 cytochrome c553 [Azospirillum canadense]